MSESENAGRGRPTDYRPEFASQAEKLCRKFGAVDTDLAEYFEVSVRTIHRWKHDHEDFCHALKSKRFADERVERALYERAIGYSHPEDKIFNNNGEEMIVETTKHYPPDTGACVVWLANRNPERWKKDPESIQAPSAPVTINLINPNGHKPDDTAV